MAQNIIIQVGQCGNQIGYQFWDAALRELASTSKGFSNDALSSFFQPSDSKNKKIENSKYGNLKARAVLIDMEEGVVNDIMKSHIGEIFPHKQLITDQSGAGNNWAVGHMDYGKKYKEIISEVIRKTAEQCDCLQCFFCIHSMGGGTGSGLGTFVLKLLEEEYPDVFRFVTALFPSTEDDVITSPYNSILAMRVLTEHANCVMPIENQALINIIKRIESMDNKRASGTIQSIQAKNNNMYDVAKKETPEKPFDSMNNIVANLLLNLTSSSRFEGSLNVDLNEISMNLVPFKKLHYLTCSMTPIYSLAQKSLMTRNIDQMFTDAFSKENQLLQLDPKNGLYLACSLFVRGKVELSDIRRNIDRMKPRLKFIYWNQDGWKTGLCSVPPINQDRVLLTLANNTCMQHTCLDIRNRCVKLYKRKAHLHHYTTVNGFEENLFSQSIDSLDWLINEYESLEKTVGMPTPVIPRLHVV